MKKGKALGIGFAVIAVAIVIGIASLPDEVLLESPELDASENTSSEMIPLNIPPIEEVTKEEPTEEVVEEEPTEEVVEEDPDESEGQVIKINIKDGVGGAER